ncbi:EDD domain protein [Erysipelothrix larvae]|uniref:EDD domain protein n=1 Tax=Erysipelothrix larvae TaxID=1514105 RepID=A0A0X8GY50_9FIRM|nr:DegV family protein [Erysipelothrix larvae]AMC92569.1 EDD domain protein [Erysipelothrix larvae]
MKTAIVTDSSADLSREDAESLGIFVARMPLTIDGEDFLEEEGISREAFIEAMKNGATVSTSQPNLFNTGTLFKNLLETHDQVLYLPISSKLSGTYQTACILAEEFGGRVVVVDTLAVSYPLLYVTLRAKELAESGVPLVEIKQNIESNSFMFASLIPESIEYLKRGGRIKPAAAAVANLLKIMPILSVTDGEIDLLDKVRTHKKALKKGVSYVVEDRNPDDYDWAVLSGDAPEEDMLEVIAEVERILGRSVVRRNIYPIVLAHTGPGTIAVTCMKKF